MINLINNSYSVVSKSDLRSATVLKNLIFLVILYVLSRHIVDNLVKVPFFNMKYHGGNLSAITFSVDKMV